MSFNYFKHLSIKDENFALVGLKLYKLFSSIVEQIWIPLHKMNTSLISKDVLYICSKIQEIDIKFLFIWGTYKAFLSSRYMSSKSNFKSPTTLVESTSPVPTLRVILSYASFFQELVSWHEKQIWLMAYESTIQVEVSYSTNHGSLPLSLLHDLNFRFSAPTLVLEDDPLKDFFLVVATFASTLFFPYQQ